MSKSLEHRLACPLVTEWRKQADYSLRSSQDQEDHIAAAAELVCADVLERFWRERVEPLIEAGQAMRDRHASGPHHIGWPGCPKCELVRAWDAALAKVKEPT